MNRLVLFAFVCGFSLFPNVESSAQKIRITAANTTSANASTYDSGEGIRIFQGVKPDIVLIQEFKYGNNTPAAIRQFVDSTFGSGFSYYRETITVGGGIPNGVISRYPIIAQGSWDDPEINNREFAWARIDIPGAVDLWAVSLHLKASSGDAGTRNQEAIALRNYIQANIPPDDFLVIGGDLNSYSRNEAQFTVLSEVVRTAGPYPADQNGNQNTNAGRSSPYDNIFSDADLDALQVPVVIGSRTFANGLVVDTRVHTPLSDLSPALFGDSGATNMQHMTIVKDFYIPPSILTVSPLTGGTVGSPFSFSFSANAGTAPYLWSVAAGTLPPGLALAADGSLAGTPTAAGIFNFSVRVTDGGNVSATAALSLEIKEPLTRFLEFHNLPAESAGVDSDGDGVVNLIEFLLGGNPTQRDSSILPKFVADAENSSVISEFPFLTAAGSVTWKIQYSVDLETWTNAPEIEGVTSTITPGDPMSQAIIRIPTNDGKYFMRLFASAP